MKTTNNKKRTSTFDRLMQNPDFQKEMEKEREGFLLSELLHAIMAGDEKSVRQLAKETGISTTAIQRARSGESKHIRLDNFMKVVEACGYDLVLKKGKENIPLRTDIRYSPTDAEYRL